MIIIILNYNKKKIMSFKKIISLICIISIAFTNFYSYFAYPIGINFSVMFMGNTEIGRFSIINKMKEMDNRSNEICGMANPMEFANTSYSILNCNNEDYQINGWHIYEGCQFMDQLTEHLRGVNAITFCIDGFSGNPLEDINDFYFNLINNYSPHVNKIFVIGKSSPFQDEHLREELEKRSNCTNYSIMRTNPENPRDI